MRNNSYQFFYTKMEKYDIMVMVRNMSRKVLIIGGGASGLLASIIIKKQHPDLEVTILERSDRPGKKLLATGGGKCNIGNINLNSLKYNNPNFVQKIIDQVPIEDYLQILKSIGIMTKIDEEGRVYPHSEASSTVVNVLLNNIKNLKIKIKNNFEVVKIEKKTQYMVRSSLNEIASGDYLVFAVGSKASAKRSQLFDIIKSYGHFIDFKPGLVGLKTREKVADLKGIRTKVELKYYLDNREVFKQLGEVNFKDDGLSGIVVMNASRNFSEVAKNTISLDLAPSLSLEELNSFINSQNGLLEDILVGLFPKMLALRIAKMSGDVCKNIKDFKLTIIDTYGLEASQVSQGGFDVDLINPRTMEFYEYPHMYAIGEVLNIDGECGGYNLYFANACALILGRNICN